MNQLIIRVRGCRTLFRKPELWIFHQGRVSEGMPPDAFLVFDDSEQSSAVQNFESMKDLDAMLASFSVDLPTLNGYSGFFPFGSYRITKCEDVDKIFAEVRSFPPSVDLSNILLVGGECG